MREEGSKDVILEVIGKHVSINDQESYHLGHLLGNQHNLAKPTGSLEGILFEGHDALRKVLAWPSFCCIDPLLLWLLVVHLCIPPLG